jgi:hypothetical protein
MYNTGGLAIIALSCAIIGGIVVRGREYTRPLSGSTSAVTGHRRLKPPNVSLTKC